METPVGRSRNRGTPGSSRLRSAVKTPKSVLTPNDDAAEKASVRRKRRSEALRLSLSDAFAGHADQHSRQQQGAAGGSSKPTLSEEARTMLLEQCLKLASENKINDRNAWSLDLITHLPDIVGSGPSRAQHSQSNSTYNFQKMSGGLDAGVTIYSKRVDLTYRSAMNLGSLGPKQQGGDGEDGYENEGGDDGDLDDAAAAAAKAQKQKGGRARQGDSADEEATLTTPDHLRAKKGDSTFAVDPLFHTMSALFDEGGAKGLLLLNRSVYDGAHIMTSPQDIPEQQFPLQQQPQQDTLLDLRPLQQQLAACSSISSAGGASQHGSVAVLTPGLPQLYALLEETLKALPGHKQRQQQACSGPDVGSIMQQALRNLPPTPVSRRVHTAQTAPAAAAAADSPGRSSGLDAAADADMADADSHVDAFAASSNADAAADMQYNSTDNSDGGGNAAAEGLSSGGVPIVASFLASCEVAADEDAAAAADESYGGEYGGFEDDGHPGYGDGDSSWGQQQQQQQDRRQSLLGLGGAQDYDDSSGLDAEALQQLLGAAGGSGKGGTTAGSGWAGSRFWKYRSAAAAAARMASGSGGGTVNRASASASKSRSGSYRIDFTSRPADLSAALAPGDPKKIRLVTAPSSSTADTLLPEDLHYQASSLLQLFLRPSAINLSRQRQCEAGAAAGTGASDGELPAWAEEGGDEDGSWGGADNGYEYDGDGAEGYNAGDLSMGDPGFSGVDGPAGNVGGEWWSPEGELLSAPKRMAGGGVRYQRSAKQVDVRALKDLLWDSLINVNINKQTSSNSNSCADPTTPQGTSAAAAPVIPFQDVIVHVPSDSAAGAIEDVSVHMCFICLLHLANERGLVVRAQEDLKTLTISNVQQQSQQRPAH